MLNWIEEYGSTIITAIMFGGIATVLYSLLNFISSGS